MDLGALFLILALALLVGVFVSRPFFRRDLDQAPLTDALPGQNELQSDHLRSSLLAERDRLLTTLQDLEFDFTLGKIPAEDYPTQRTLLMQETAAVLRKLDELDGGENTAASAPAAEPPALVNPNSAEALEAKISAYRRSRQEKTSSFCPKCGVAVLKTDKFCAHCGTTL